MHYLFLLQLCLAFILVPGASAKLAAAGFVCAGHAAPPADTGIAAKRVSRAWAYLPSQGQVHVLVVFAQFTDEAPRPVPDHAANLFDPDLPGSLTHFYHTMSGGQLRVQGTVLPKRYRSDQPVSAPPGAEDSFTGRTTTVQWTNVSEYQGYRLTTTTGFEVRRLDSVAAKAETRTRGFITIYAGVEQ